MSDVVDVLVKAKALVAEGWCQVHFHTADGKQHCAEGAIMMAGGYDPHRYIPAVRALSNVVEPVLGEFCSVMLWNDREGRTQAEVLDAFDRAIRLAKDDHA